MSQQRTLIPTRVLTRNARTGVALALVATALTPGAASAAAGDRDPTFGTNGTRTVPGTEQPLDVFVQPDGKIVSVAGANSLFSFKGFLVRRVLADGSPDKSFDGDGAALAPFPTVTDTFTPKGAALQPDGRIVVAGQAGSAGTAVARFGTDGSLDKTFDEGGADGDGRALINTNLQGFSLNDVALQPSGKIALAGTQGNDSDFGILRLRSDGSPDGTAFDPGDFADHSDLALVATPGLDGTTVVVGTTDTPTGNVTAIARYKSDGKLDSSLAGSGKTTIASIGDPAAAIVQPDGKLLVAGSSGQYGDRKMVVARLTREGVLDTTFGTGGSAEIDDDRDNSANSIVLQPDGKILVAGSAGGTVENATFDAVVVRYDAAGRPDPSYGSGGRVNFSTGEISIGGPSALQQDGKLVVNGYGASSLVPRPSLTRLLGDPEPAPAAPAGPGGGEPTTPQPQQQAQQDQPDQGVVTNPADTVAPRLSGLRVTAPRKGRSRFDLRFTLSEPARVRFTLQRVPSKGRARAVRGSFSIAGKAGATRVDIARRSLVRRLAAGRYRLVATATDAAGNRGAATRAPFTVTRKR